jgi:hypothetical protein
MKCVLVLSFTTIILVGCNIESINYRQKSEGSVVVTTGTPDADSCGEDNYAHKAETEIAEMTPAQRVNEYVKEQVYHMPSDDNYGFAIIVKYIRKDGVNVLPVLTEYVNAYQPKDASQCERTRFFVAYSRADDLDNMVFRVRGTKEGSIMIDALERAIQRMREVGFDKADSKNNKDFSFALLHLNGLKGINSIDNEIKNTLRARNNILLTDKELLDFTDFLISRDPYYPTWSELDESGPPPRLLKDSKRFYEAYLQFKAKK